MSCSRGDLRRRRDASARFGILIICCDASLANRAFTRTEGEGRRRQIVFLLVEEKARHAATGGTAGRMRPRCSRRTVEEQQQKERAPARKGAHYQSSSSSTVDLTTAAGDQEGVLWLEMCKKILVIVSAISIHRRGDTAIEKKTTRGSRNGEYQSLH